MGCNIGKTDQMARFILGILFVLAYFLHWTSGSLSLILLLLGIIFIITAFIRFCPLYLIFKINTCNNNK